jgi:inorganic triphosphatase YgiF
MRVPTGSAGAGPSRAFEIELKFDVDHATPLPDLSALPGVAALANPEVRELDARYFDTASLDLARAGYALRRRTGGPDAGWHLKGPRVDGARLELGWPIGDDATLPDAVRAEVDTVTDAELLPLARIRNRRTAHVLLDVAGGVVAEFVDDDVRASDERTGAERAWREWEFELGPAAPTGANARGDLFAAVEAAVAAVGGRAAASDSKLARALGQ